MSTAFFKINVKLRCWALRHQFKIMVAPRESHSSRDSRVLPRRAHHPPSLTDREAEVQKRSSLLTVLKCGQVLEKKGASFIPPRAGVSPSSLIFLLLSPSPCSHFAWLLLSSPGSRVPLFLHQPRACIPPTPLLSVLGVNHLGICGRKGRALLGVLLCWEKLTATVPGLWWKDNYRPDWWLLDALARCQGFMCPAFPPSRFLQDQKGAAYGCLRTFPNVFGSGWPRCSTAIWAASEGRNCHQADCRDLKIWLIDWQTESTAGWCRGNSTRSHDIPAALPGSGRSQWLIPSLGAEYAGTWVLVKFRGNSEKSAWGLYRRSEHPQCPSQWSEPGFVFPLQSWVSFKARFVLFHPFCVEIKCVSKEPALGFATPLTPKRNAVMDLIDTVLTEKKKANLSCS